MDNQQKDLLTQLNALVDQLKQLDDKIEWGELSTALTEYVDKTRQILTTECLQHAVEQPALVLDKKIAGEFSLKPPTMLYDKECIVDKITSYLHSAIMRGFLTSELHALSGKKVYFNVALTLDPPAKGDTND